MRPLTAVATGLGIAAAAGLAYSAGYEVRAFRLRRVEIPLLPPGAPSVRVLHISDLHMTPNQVRKQRWVRELAALEPDLVVNTGDNLAHAAAVPAVLEAYGALFDLPGVFVFGSNDYFSPVPKNPARYLMGPSAADRRHPDLPWRELAAQMCARGWQDLNHQRATLKVQGMRIDFAGTDDAHLGYDNYELIAGRPDPDADVTIGVTHAPYLRLLDAFVADGYPMIMAGHTHGGQLRLPIAGALVTNCDLDTRRARGLSVHPSTGHSSTVDEAWAWLHVSAGLGTSPYTPFRFCCHPEATLLTLTPRC